jgi:K+-sensing histidine kinase KdpD
VLNKSNNDRLNSLLLVQESLKPLVAGTTSPTNTLPGVLVSILEALDSRDGRLILFNLEKNLMTTASVINCHVETETTGALPGALKEEIEELMSRHSREVYVANTQNEDGWSVASHPQTTTDPWSAISVPIRTEKTAVGLLTILKPGPDRFLHEDAVLSSLFASQIGATLSIVQLNEEARSAEKRSQELLRDNQNLAAILVHDLQGPLGNVLTSLEMVQEGLDHQEDSALALMIDIAVRSSNQLQALVSSLLDISRLEAGQEVTGRQPISVSDLVDYVAEIEGPLLEQRQVSLSRGLSPNLPLINVNADIILRVLLNLIDNALKVSKKGQIIAIRANVENDGPAIKISVVDQGPGIPEAYRERIFEKYQRVTAMSTSQGLGLGLAFCKLAVEAHGGRIWVEDSAGEGACFCLTLPVVDNPIPIS